MVVIRCQVAAYNRFDEKATLSSSRGLHEQSILSKYEYILRLLYNFFCRFSNAIDEMGEIAKMNVVSTLLIWFLTRSLLRWEKHIVNGGP